MKKSLSLLLLMSGAVLTGILFLKNSNTKTVKHRNFYENETPMHAFDALQFLSTAAAFPNKDIPGDAYIKAIDWYSQNKTQSAKSTQATSSWFNIGPNDIGGRTNAFAFDPTDTATIWLGSASGGLWKSTTGGMGVNAWTYVPLGFPVLGVSAIAINPNNKNEMYVGSGEVYGYGTNQQGIGDIRTSRGSYGMGLFKSTNGGTTWTQVLNWTYQQNRGIWDIVINPLKPTTVYAATTEGVYKSTNSGVTWTLILNEKMCMDLEMHKIDTNIILCGVGNVGSATRGVYRTSNSGAVWAKVTNGLPLTAYQGRTSLLRYTNNNDIMYAHVCDIYNTIGLYKSIDKGVSWALVNNTDFASYQGWYTKGMAVQPGNPNNILVGGVYVWQSFDAGANFSQQSNYDYHSDIHDIVVNPLDANKIYVITDAGLFRSADFGANFASCTNGYITSQHYIGSISSIDTTVMLSGLQDNNTIKYLGSSAWYPVMGGDGAYNAIDHTNDQNQYGSYQYLNIYNDPSQGTTYFPNPILLNGNFSTGGNFAGFLAPYILCYSNTSYMYAGGKTLQRSTNGGGTWNVMGNNPVYNNMQIMAIACSFSNTDSIYFATSPDASFQMKMFRSSNGGASVTDISTGLPNRYPRRIAVNPKDSREVYAVFSGFGTGHVFKSTNSGTTWTDISTALPDMPFECVTVAPGNVNTVFVGCDYGVFVSYNKGATWTTFDTGFPDATMVFDLIVSPSDNYLYAFTHGRGIYKRDLNGIVAGEKNIAKHNVSLKLYPNPTNNELHINFKNSGNDKFTAYIYNLEGKKVKSVTLEESENTIYVSDLANGGYILSVHKNNEPFSYNSFVKQ